MTASISLLRAFEAAARTGSFQVAAGELHLTPSAVSHAIRKLEQELGVVLFEREVRHVRLSADGQALMRHVGPAFEDIRRGMTLVSTRGPRLLRVHSAPSFAAQWLTPRLPRFLAENPDIEIRLAAGTDYTKFTSDDFDVDIVYGRTNLDGVVVLPLGEEIVTPLCVPRIAKQIHKPEDLFSHLLIESDNKKVRWRDWFAANGLSPPPPHGMRFDRSFLAIHTAANGLGIALESKRLAEREIDSGLLVPAVGSPSVDVRYVGHYLVFPRLALRRQTLQIFLHWISRELKLEMESTLGLPIPREFEKAR
ncbi:LysR family transcriptional regulator [Bradyrhizobium jicamae]|uniref:LysR family transcriptional regulator n=1 Tax=Bradyrhizobium jicamae TaxID=280332 RepID=A0ABS5FDT1_9BRAD|nr:LysR substrate-binding domain-containing protein [Bradyrhizobium jicamae]MBR0794957.1 LysR family transcriptional regulator [Bradyrhizobium jicamae]